MGVAWNLSTCVIRASGAGVLQVVPSRPSPSSTSTEVLGVGLAGRHVTLVLVLIMWSTMSCNCYYCTAWFSRKTGDVETYGAPTEHLLRRALLVGRPRTPSFVYLFCKLDLYWSHLPPVPLIPVDVDILCDSSCYLRLNYFICAVSVKSLCEFCVYDRYFTYFMLEIDQAYWVSKKVEK